VALRLKKDGTTLMCHDNLRGMLYEEFGESRVMANA
jgi:hypothetical protein